MEEDIEILNNELLAKDGIIFIIETEKDRVLDENLFLKLEIEKYRSQISEANTILFNISFDNEDSIDDYKNLLIKYLEKYKI